MGYLIVNDALPYKVYSAEISQTGTSAPTEVNLFQNTIGIINYLYTSAGNYTINSANLFTIGKVFILFNLAAQSGSSEPAIITTRIIDDSNILLESFLFDAIVPKFSTDNNLINGSLEIRVYN